ncbi:hypothetical protein BCD93_001388 [Clostridium saccharoperbutylacetonicum]|nr:hypothetical protein [Clostridium saccharoperbutylacetonicum]
MRSNNIIFAVLSISISTFYIVKFWFANKR